MQSMPKLKSHITTTRLRIFEEFWHFTTCEKGTVFGGICAQSNAIWLAGGAVRKTQ